MKQALKLAEAKGTQDVFGRLLFLSFQQKIDVSTVCQYPIVPEPHCFTYPNGALRDNPKSNACKILKGMVNTEAPQNSNTVNADGMFLIQSTLRCLNYGIFVQKVVLSVLSDLCFDIYESLSKTQKDTKRKKEEMSFTLVQKQKWKQTCMICYSCLVLSKSWLDSFLSK